MGVLMAVMDRGKMSVPVKGSYVPFYGVKIALTSNKTPKEWYPNQDKEALLSRICKQHPVTRVWKPIPGVKFEYREVDDGAPERVEPLSMTTSVESKVQVRVECTPQSAELETVSPLVKTNRELAKQLNALRKRLKDMEEPKTNASAVNVLEA